MNQKPALLLKGSEGSCFIPLNKQDMKRFLDEEEMLTQNTFENPITFEPMQNLEPCQPEIAQAALNSLNNNEIEVAAGPAAILVIISSSALASFYTNCFIKDRVFEKENPSSVQSAFITACHPMRKVKSWMNWFYE